MAIDLSKVRVGITGVVSSGPTTSTAPTSSSSALTGFTDLGGVSDDGVTVTLPDSGDTTTIKLWQNNATARVIRGTSDDSPEISLTLAETKLETLQLYYGVTVSGQTATDGAFVVNAGVNRTYVSFVIDVVDGANLKRIYVPNGYISSVGDMVFSNQELIGHEITISADLDPVKGYQMKVWDTAAKTP